MSDQASTSTLPSPASLLERKKHTSFLLRCLHLLPQPYTSADDQRMTLGYFALSSLDLLSSLDRISPEERLELIDWVYAQQVSSGGFRGSPSDPTAPANVAMTYSALLILAVLRDDFKGLNRGGLIRWVGELQSTSGGFTAELGGAGEVDPRFTYCAVAICSMLNEWQAIDVDGVRTYIEGCQRYDGGYGANSGGEESHAGMTYCCVASLHLLPLPSPSDQEGVVSWLVHRQVPPPPPPAPISPSSSPSSSSSSSSSEPDEELLGGGFQGRPCKIPPDICYSFWNGASLSLLNQHSLIDGEADAGYILSSQSKVGGLSKVPGEHPDLLHTYLGLAALALHGRGLGLKELDAGWNCSRETKEWIQAHLSRK